MMIRKVVLALALSACCVLASSTPFSDIGAGVGGAKHTDGTEIHCDLPGKFHRRNTSSHGLGLCVFTSIHHAATWQNVAALQEFPKWIRDNNIPGGSEPRKTATMIARMCKARNLPEPDYLQVQSRDLEILKLACSTGRMVCVTYSRSPTGRYGGRGISHMVNIVHADDKWFVVLDNNYPGDTAYEWMTPQEFLKTYAGGGNGWAVILLAPPPPPPPVN